MKLFRVKIIRFGVLCSLPGHYYARRMGIICYYKNVYKPLNYELIIMPQEKYFMPRMKFFVSRVNQPVYAFIYMCVGCHFRQITQCLFISHNNRIGDIRQNIYTLLYYQWWYSIWLSHETLSGVNCSPTSVKYAHNVVSSIPDC